MGKLNAKGGRPSRYKKEYAELAYNYCLLGSTDAQLAVFFGVKEQTINNWKKAHKEFFESIKRAKYQADAQVAQSLFHRATGYQHPDTHISNYQGNITQTDIIKHYAPDPTSAIFWLKNRQPEIWRDKKDVELEGNVQVTEITRKII